MRFSIMSLKLSKWIVLMSRKSGAPKSGTDIPTSHSLAAMGAGYGVGIVFTNDTDTDRPFGIHGECRDCVGIDRTDAILRSHRGGSPCCRYVGIYPGPSRSGYESHGTSDLRDGNTAYGEAHDFSFKTVIQVVKRFRNMCWSSLGPTIARFSDGSFVDTIAPTARCTSDYRDG